MKYRQLLSESKTHYDGLAAGRMSLRPTGWFSFGAFWMYERLHELEPEDGRPFYPAVPYAWYGRMKYGVCLGAGIAGLAVHGLFALPVSVALFYLMEIHILFLFPLLIDGVRRPVMASIRATYKIGLGRCLAVVIPIAVFMTIGLLRRADRLRNWYIGCLAILIWYRHEIRDRL